MVGFKNDQLVVGDGFSGNVLAGINADGAVTNNCDNCTAFGFAVNGGGGGNPEGNDNSAFGTNALTIAGNCGDCTALGFNALSALVDGSYNTAIGSQAGSNYLSTEASNISINSSGTIGESNTLRIGQATGTDTQNLNQAFICGIQGIGVSGAPVLVSTSDQLGVTVSSAEFKENIQDMGDDSSPIMDLRPVTFEWKDKKNSSERQFGLIAEEVAEKFPHLVFYKDNKPFTVKYHELPAILLNEMQKMAKEIEDLKKQIGELNG